MIQLFQFTDTHLFDSPNKSLCGMNTADSLNAVLDAALNNGWPPDVVLATGDLSQDETPASYQYFLEVFSTLHIPVFCLPGNHDVPDRMHELLSADYVQTTRQILFEDWQILMLDSSVPGQHGGNFRKSELVFLSDCLSENKDMNTLVCLHHNVLPTNTSWLDTMTLKNAREFFDVTDRFKNVKGILTGHIHQEFETVRNGVPIMGSPSTCIQFMPGSKKFSLDTRPPGYRWIELHSDGAIKTGVKRLKKFDFTPDLSSKGY